MSKLKFYGIIFLSFSFFLSLWLCWVFIAVCRLSLVVVSPGYSLAVVHGFLIVVASPVAEHRL